jgi:N-acetylneuraminate synthase
MARRSLYASRFIPEGKILNIDDVIPKRPGVGIPVYKFDSVIGKKCNRDIEKDFLLRLEYFD